ncbi:sigma-70 family RNA polymerase sigma factor SigL [Nonomuraea rosea]|uniref:Sigma-70 family RNA polymerase sigma factor SigL n=2 Tax=Nonomuraea rosea TaxID=638574 RepID=A0ABP6ZMQ0_9ACTN
MGVDMTDAHAALLRALYDEHAPALWRFVVRLTGDNQFAHDVVQETLLRAWKSPEVFHKGETASRAWLYTVARNVVIDHSRSAQVRREVGTDQLPEPSSADRVDATLDAWLVTDALAQLSENHRTVVVRAYYGGESVAELAEELDLPPGTVKSRLHYALRALRLALQEKGVTTS